MTALTAAPTATIEIAWKITSSKVVAGVSVGSGERVEEPEGVGTA
jgi:hypothetical protein